MSAVITAPGPARLIPGGRYSIEFAVDVAVAKYLDHIPLERQVRVMAREGLTVDSQTLWDQLHALARHLAPTYEAVGERARTSDVMHADETWWRMMDRRTASRWWAWCLASDEAVFDRILPSRSSQAAQQLVGDYTGVIVRDGYTAYDVLARASPGLVLAHCWAHYLESGVIWRRRLELRAGAGIEAIDGVAAPDNVGHHSDDRPGDRAGAGRALRREGERRLAHDDGFSWPNGHEAEAWEVVKFQ